MIRTLILRMADPLYMSAYLGFIPFVLLAAYGIVVLWKGFSYNTAPGVPRWLYFLGGAVYVLSLPVYGWFMKCRGLL